MPGGSGRSGRAVERAGRTIGEAREQRPDAEPIERLADLPVERLPEDAPERARAAVDAAPPGLEPADLAHEPAAPRGPKGVMDAYAAALGDADAVLAAA